jgi:hypothetical protein
MPTMKNASFFFIFLMGLMIASSCTNSKQARSYRADVNGKWQLQTINTEGIAGKIKTQILNEADLNCFIGSSWIFNQNNSLGSYTINANGGECAPVKRELRWSIYEALNEPQLLQFKKVDSNLKEIEEGNAGYRFTILELTTQNMRLQNDITFEGKPASIIYNFVKTN